MSKVINCPTCGGKAKVREKNGVTNYVGLTDEEKGKKIQQLKKAMIKFKEKAERLEKEIEVLKRN
jgi:hypothetical protein